MENEKNNNQLQIELKEEVAQGTYANLTTLPPYHFFSYLCTQNNQNPIMFMKIDYPSVLLIYTGGTIGMIENPETGALENFNFDHLLKHVPELKRFNYRISSYQFDPPIDSSDMEPSLWAKIVKIINYNYDYFDGFVILHGTDTMSYTDRKSVV